MCNIEMDIKSGKGYVYEVYAQTRDACGGFPCGSASHSQRLKIFFDEEKAKKFKAEWEALWQEHADKNECSTPCWYDYDPTLDIVKVEVEI